MRASSHLPTLLAPFALDWQISEDDRQYAETVGISEIDLVWGAFIGHHVANDARTANVSGNWRKWVANELPRQRVQRERRRGPSATKVPPKSDDLSASRRAEWERESSVPTSEAK